VTGVQTCALPICFDDQAVFLNTVKNVATETTKIVGRCGSLS
jgi:hypothetical protein